MGPTLTAMYLTLFIFILGGALIAFFVFIG